MTSFSKPAMMTLRSLLKLTAMVPSCLASLAVYWGQAESDKEQTDLLFYCSSQAVDTINLAFVSRFGQKHIDQDNSDGFVLNLSSMCTQYNDYRYSCPKVNRDIKECQKLGKKIVISIGGEDNSNEKYGFIDDNEAKRFAHILWDHFAEGHSANRPFGDAIVDGFDFDIETRDQTGYLELANELKSIVELNGTKDYLFTAAPQCGLNERDMEQLLDNFEMDRLYIQFYNNKDCELLSDGFNYYDWANEVISRGHSSTKLYIGLPSASKAASSGFIKDVGRLQDVCKDILADSRVNETFGGLMFWDASRGFDLYERDSRDSSYIFRAWSALNALFGEGLGSGVTMTNDTGGQTVDNGSSTTSTRNGAGLVLGQHVYASFSYLLILISFIFQLI